MPPLSKAISIIHIVLALALVYTISGIATQDFNPSLSNDIQQFMTELNAIEDELFQVIRQNKDDLEKGICHQVCPLGEKGPPGVPGEHGSPGLRGLLGTDGVKGARGRPCTSIPAKRVPKPLRGDIGPDGVKGDVGQIGDRMECECPLHEERQCHFCQNRPLGSKGYKGRRGYPGLSGLQGETGRTGDVVKSPIDPPSECPPELNKDP